jgi:single-strand DNA-binding protein
MAHITGIFRLGKDAELRYTASSEPVVSVALAYNYGKKGDNGQRPSQWIEAAMFGKRAEALAQYLTKGSQISALLSDPHIQTYQKKDGGEGFKLSAKVVDIELIGGRQEAAPARAPRPAPAPARQAPAQSSGFDDMDDDIPF